MEALRHRVTSRLNTVYVDGGLVLANDVTAVDPKDVEAPSVLFMIDSSLFEVRVCVVISSCSVVCLCFGI